MRVRDVFARFLPESIVDEVLARADGEVRLGGVRLIGTVLFTDLRGFTTFAEQTAPDRVIDVLNRFLSEMSDAVLDNGGTLVSYLGDGLLAVFGAPIECDDHADRALAAAREMLHAAPAALQRLARPGGGRRGGFAMGVGVSSGPLMSGNVGSERRLEYTAIGDTVNTAARIEAHTKEVPHHALFSDSTRALLTSPTSWCSSATSRCAEERPDPALGARHVTQPTTSEVTEMHASDSGRAGWRRSPL